MKYKLSLLIVLLAILALTGYAVLLQPAALVAAAPQPVANASPAPVAAPRFGALGDLEAALQNIYSQVNPSVVAIDVVMNATTASPNFPSNHPNVGPSAALGSGFVWDTAGHIVTNNHVVDGATSIRVTFFDGSTAPAKLVAADPDSDLAVIVVNVPANQLTPVQMGDSTQVKVGQFAIAIGNPYGEQNTMTTGIISALGRTLPSSNGSNRTTTITGPSYTIPDVIQTDAPINPGNSGGVLVNADGKVIGVTAAIESAAGSSAGIGFAIPSAIVNRVVPALITTGRYAHAYLGISGATLTTSIAQAMNLPANQRGAIVGAVTPNGPSDKAGLRGSTQTASVDGVQSRVGGDVITAIDGKPIKTFDDIVAYLASSTKVDQTVTLTILRDGKEQKIKVTLQARPGSAT